MFLVQHRFKFLSKTMPTQGVGFLTRKIDHRNIGVKGLLKNSGGTVIWLFISGTEMVAIGLIEQIKNRNHKPDRIAY